jgi:glycosyltransferase involved in cell wall biosynthesis
MAAPQDVTADAHGRRGDRPTTKPETTTLKPLVSIVTPSYNQGEFIADAIDSVLSQDYPRIEYIVMDGGSTDATLDVLRGYGDRVRWKSGRDAGQSDAISKGFLDTSGKYIAWLNSDDRYMPGAISAAVDELEANPAAAFVYGMGEFIDRAGSLIGPCEQIEPWDFERLLGTLDFVLQPATLFRHQVYLEIGGIDTSLNYVMDYDLWLRFGSKYPVRFLPRVLAQARVYGETKTNTGGLPRLQELERVVRRNGGRGLPKNFRREMYFALRHATALAAKDGQLGHATRLAAQTLPYAARAAMWKLRRLRSAR